MASDSDSSNPINDKSSPQKEENEVTATDRDAIRKELSTMSFEDLQKLKEKIGSKQYNEMIFGKKTKKAPTTSFKRANKNRPREMSSKKRAHQQNQINQTKILPARDPRFDPLCGTYDDKIFKSNYKFLKDIRKKERVQLEKEFKKEEDPKKKQKIKFLMQRMDNQIREQEKQEKLNLEIEEEQKDIHKKLMKGEKPIFKKKSEKRIESLVNKYEELKKNNKLQKHLERRYKKLAQKEKKRSETNMGV